MSVPPVIDLGPILRKSLITSEILQQVAHDKMGKTRLQVQQTSRIVSRTAN